MDSPEFQLLLACCRCSISEEAGEDVHCPSGQIDWQGFMALVRRHRVQGLVAQAFYKQAIAAPADVLAELASDAAAAAGANLRAARESGRLADAFERASIPLLFVKGLTLSALAYGDPFIKVSADLDLLVDHRSIATAAALLEKLGYRRRVPKRLTSGGISMWHDRHKESMWLDPSSGFAVDLHSRLSDNPALIPAIGMSSPRQLAAITAALSLPTLSSADLLVYLCVHGASSAWFRLKWIVDFAALMRASKASGDVVLREASAHRATRAAAQALLLAEHLSLLSLPDPLRRELAGDAASRLLAQIALSQLRAREEPTQRRLGTLSIHLSQLLLQERWSFKLSELARQGTEIVDRRR